MKGGKNMVELSIKEQKEIKGGYWVIFLNNGEVYTYSSKTAAKQAYLVYKIGGMDPLLQEATEA